MQRAFAICFVTTCLILLSACSVVEGVWPSKRGEEISFTVPIITFDKRNNIGAELKTNALVIRAEGHWNITPKSPYISTEWLQNGFPPGTHRLYPDGFLQLGDGGMFVKVYDAVPALDCSQVEGTGVTCSPDFKVELYDTRPNDPMALQQWSIEWMRLDKAWDYRPASNEVEKEEPGTIEITNYGLQLYPPTCSEGVDNDVWVFVIDTGISDHPDLRGNLHPDFGWAMDGGNGLNDDNGHGTHVAGIIGAIGNNSRGIAGAFWDVNLVPVKFLGSGGGGSMYDAVRAVDHVRELKRTQGLERVIINASWGSRGDSAPLREAIRDAIEEGIVFVAAAGNDGTSNDQYPHFPSNYSFQNLIAVAALDPDGGLASYSNFGLSSVKIAAPGSQVLSTLPQERYGALSGTSMAAPAISGVLALSWAVHPNFTPTRLVDGLKATSVARRTLAEKIEGGRQVDALGAVLDSPQKCLRKRYRNCAKPCPPKKRGKQCRRKCRLDFNCWVR